MLFLSSFQIFVQRLPRILKLCALEIKGRQRAASNFATRIPCFTVWYPTVGYKEEVDVCPKLSKIQTTLHRLIRVAVQLSPKRMSVDCWRKPVYMQIPQRNPLTPPGNSNLKPFCWEVTAQIMPLTCNIIQYSSS